MSDQIQVNEQQSIIRGQLIRQHQSLPRLPIVHLRACQPLLTHGEQAWPREAIA